MLLTVLLTVLLSVLFLVCSRVPPRSANNAMCLCEFVCVRVCLCACVCAFVCLCFCGAAGRGCLSFCMRLGFCVHLIFVFYFLCLSKCVNKRHGMAWPGVPCHAMACAGDERTVIGTEAGCAAEGDCASGAG